jgi:hypothetical protein
MVGCVIKVILNNENPQYIENTFFRNQIAMPLAPATGLYLKEMSFDSYNKKKDIPEVLHFEDIPTVDEMETKITEFIVAQDKNEWMDWVVKLRESIYHGIEYRE